MSPEDAFVHLHGDQPLAFWLDGDGPMDAPSRYGYMGAPTRPGDRVVRWFATRRELVVERNGRAESHEQDLLTWIERTLEPRASTGAPPPFPLRGGLVGYFGYGLHGQPGARASSPTTLPDAMLLQCQSYLAFDHHEQVVYAVAEADDHAQARHLADALAERLEGLPPAPPVRSEGKLGPIPFRLARGRDQYLRDIETCLAEIRRGESYEICLTTQLLGPSVARPLDAYRILRALNPAPFGAYLRLGELAVLSCSPELFLRVDPTGRVLTKPIKGTAPRGATPTEDDRLRRRLAGSVKDRAENLMIVDLLRNDLGRVCEVGSVEVPTLMAVESFATVHQLVSTVCGQLGPGRTVVDCLRAAFPGGSMTGAPKVRTMEILDALEPRPRGIYSGCLGYLSADGAAELAMTIRTAVVTPQETSIGVGGAIVALSDPRTELDELLLKGRALTGGIAAAKTGHGNAAIIVDEPSKPLPPTSPRSKAAPFEDPEP
ncbi:aminodeoxychorismate synthase component I [Paraliomyxa miuraensis]|nr:aminodeoxychorismate synthase component I [Paraliomyxa miuraensis]